LFYFQLPITAYGTQTNETFALISQYSQPHQEILNSSYGTLWSSTHGRIEDMQVISAKSILSVVSMIPHSLTPNDLEQWYFACEKPGLEVARMGGVEESMTNE
jgi:hypothetical protein